jgi:tRNA(adenine34) deaminase
VTPADRRRWMHEALNEARAALGTGDVPVGAVVVDEQGRRIGSGRNAREATGDPLAHAEVLALRSAADTVGSWRLDGCTLVVTLEPCTMCAGAVLAARVPRVVFGAWDEKAGAVGSTRDVLRDGRVLHRTEVVAGVEEDECAALLRTFFEERRVRGAPPSVGSPPRGAAAADAGGA